MSHLKLDVKLDLNDPAFVADPYPTYHRLRAEEPVHFSEMGFWVLTRYDDVVATLRDQRFSKQEVPAALAARFGRPLPPELGRSMVDRDPPDHTRLRGLVSKAFTPRAIEALRPRVQQIVDGLIDGFESRGSFDLVEEFAYPLPVIVICEMLGVPVRDQEQFKRWSLDISRSTDAVLSPQGNVLAARAHLARRELVEYYRELIAERVAAPRDDILSALIAAEEAGDKLSEHELIGNLVLLLVGGHETTVNLLGNGLLALLQHPEQLRRLREHPEIIGSAVEELLRYDTPLQRTARIATVPVTIGDCRIEPGQMVMPFMAAANRDPAQFRDPDRLDLTRADNRHVSFGWGVHFCLGGPLARAEVQTAIQTLLRRLPTLALASTRHEYRPSLTIRGLKTLPVTC